MKKWAKFANFLVIALTSLGGAQEIKDTPEELKSVEIIEHLGEKLPQGLMFTDSSGKQIVLDRILSSTKPTIFSMVYYECPMLCTLVLNSVLDVMKDSKFTLGKDFNMVSVSIDPQETSAMAAQKKKNYLKEAKVKQDSSWSFLTGSEENIATLSNALGFQYKYIKETDEYAHPAAFYVVTPDQKISRYFYGVKHEAKNFDLALVEAGKGNVGNAFDKFLLYCYRYDPDAKGYVLFAWRLMRTGGALAVVAIALFLGLLFKRDMKSNEPRSLKEDVA